MNDKIAGCVVLFNPDKQVPENIRTYLTGLDHLFLIDNSPTDQDWLKEMFPEAAGKLTYFSMQGNKGIAMALNMAAELARAKNYNWLLTMDQDSHFLPGDLPKLTGAIPEVKALTSNAGIITAFQQVHKTFPQQSKSKFSELRSAMTSGNLLNLHAYAGTGPFENKLFIDYVDHEYCLRLRKKGYSIIQVNDVQLVHSLGHFELRKFMGKTIGISNHNPVRRYYITRNGLYTAVKYAKFDRRVSWFIMKGMITDFFRVLFFEKQKGKKMKAMIRGCVDAVCGRYGKPGSF